MAHGLSKTDLATLLGRTRGNLVPGSGYPKIDYVIELAKVIDWSIEDVVKWIVADRMMPGTEVEDSGDLKSDQSFRSFQDLDEFVVRSSLNVRFNAVRPLIGQLRELADTAEQRAKARIRELNIHVADGWFMPAIDLARSALQQGSLSATTEAALNVNLASGHAGLGNPIECRAFAELVTHYYSNARPRSEGDRSMEAFGLFLSAESFRMAPSDRPSTVARSLYSRASTSFGALASDFGSYVYRDMELQCQALSWRVQMLHEGASTDEVIREALERLNSPEPRFADCEASAYWAIGALLIAARGTDPILDVDPTYLRSLFDSATGIARSHGNWEMLRDLATIADSNSIISGHSTGLNLEELVGLVSRFPRLWTAQARLVPLALENNYRCRDTP